jgi:hypothetical protein
MYISLLVFLYELNKLQITLLVILCIKLWRTSLPIIFSSRKIKYLRKCVLNTKVYTIFLYSVRTDKYFASYTQVERRTSRRYSCKLPLIFILF